MIEPSDRIRRAPEAAQHVEYDLVIIGGGIYGAMLALESVRHGMKPLLLERGDFGGKTSFNSLRIVHGGLRYLQKLDLHRFRESVAERKWFLKTFTHLVKPLPCLMPLYGKGLHRPWVLKAALLMNDRLAAQRNEGVMAANHLKDGLVLSPDETRRLFPAVSTSGLKGAAKWYDAVMLNSQRVLIEVLRWACRLGATVLNYVEAEHLLTEDSTVGGICAIDRLNGHTYQYRAPVVVNAAGPWSRKMAAEYDKDLPDLFRPSLAWNLLLNRPSLSDHALALSPRRNEGHTYFLVPWKGKIFAGTGHAQTQWKPGMSIGPSEMQLSAFLSDLNAAVPDLKLNLSDIAYVHTGLLPVTQTGGTTLSVREVIVDHGVKGGPRGFYSVSGVKFTTARLVAEKTLRMIAPEDMHNSSIEAGTPSLDKYRRNWKSILTSNGADSIRNSLLPLLSTIIDEESVCRTEDLIFRRTSLYENNKLALEIAPDVVNMLETDRKTVAGELNQIKNQLNHPWQTLQND